MEKNKKIYVAGHKGLVGSAILRKLKEKGYNNLIFKTSKELDLTKQQEVEFFFKKENIDYVFLAAAKVGGILANSTYTAEFIYNNIMIAVNVIHASYKYGVKKLLNLGSSCIYPKLAPQPLKEEYLLTGALEPTNEPYAIAKISAIKMCRYYNQQYGTNFLSVMPTNLFGPNDNFDLETSHVLPALIRKFHLSKMLQMNNYEMLRKDIKRFGLMNINISDNNNSIKNQLSKKYGLTNLSVTLWGTGSPSREFLYVDDLIDACIFLMEKYNFGDIGEFVNIGCGKDVCIKELSLLISEIIGFSGDIIFDKTKPDGTPKKLLDTSKINKLSWHPKIKLKNGIKKVYQWYLEELKSV